jgi:hypothetical protein
MSMHFLARSVPRHRVEFVSRCSALRTHRRAWRGNALPEPPDSVEDQQRVSQKVHLRLPAEATAASYSVLCYQSVREALSVPSARHADFFIKKPRCNWLLQRGLQCRGEPRCTFVNDTAGLPLALTLLPQVYHFSGLAVLQLVDPGLYRKLSRTPGPAPAVPPSPQ